MYWLEAEAVEERIRMRELGDEEVGSDVGSDEPVVVAEAFVERAGGSGFVLAAPEEVFEYEEGTMRLRSTSTARCVSESRRVFDITCTA